MAEHDQICVDPSDWEGMNVLMDRYGDSQSMTLGLNEEGEDVSISISHDRIVTTTYQANGWMRENVYHRDGTQEELFLGRWNAPEMHGPQLG